MMNGSLITNQVYLNFIGDNLPNGVNFSGKSVPILQALFTQALLV